MFTGRRVVADMVAIVERSVSRSISLARKKEGNIYTELSSVTSAFDSSIS